MRQLVLAKHSRVAVRAGVPPDQWLLDDEGRRRALSLARRLRDHRPTRVVSSTEAKARETADIVGRELGVPVVTREGLREHDRSDVPLLGEDAFRDAVGELFARPDALVLGRETGRAAADRFCGAIDALLAEDPDRDVVVVAHGTVISLFAQRRAALDPYALWSRLGMPSFVALTLPDFAVARVVEDAGT